jgi:hypothetical protein
MNGYLGAWTAGLRWWDWEKAKVQQSVFGMTAGTPVEAGRAFG